jgi:hypothetical protein
VHKLLFEQILA